MIGLYSHTIRSARRVCAKCARLDCVSHNWLTPPRAVLASVEAFGLERVRDVTGYAHCDLAAGVGMACAVSHCTKSRGQVASIGAVVLATEGEQGVLLPAAPAKGVGLIV